ncbi:hypothetical protein DFS34DRAFT_591710 [Phlyctochytrium arcticum]|nr:hypothetical protein DFS34DRAFT_591710 [Phlyctochytrium arcticum]
MSQFSETLPVIDEEEDEHTSVISRIRERSGSLAQIATGLIQCARETASPVIQSANFHAHRLETRESDCKAQLPVKRDAIARSWRLHPNTWAYTSATTYNMRTPSLAVEMSRGASDLVLETRALLQQNLGEHEFDNDLWEYWSKQTYGVSADTPISSPPTKTKSPSGLLKLYEQRIDINVLHRDNHRKNRKFKGTVMAVHDIVHLKLYKLKAPA